MYFTSIQISQPQYKREIYRLHLSNRQIQNIDNTIFAIPSNYICGTGVYFKTSQ